MRGSNGFPVLIPWFWCCVLWLHRMNVFARNPHWNIQDDEASGQQFTLIWFRIKKQFFTLFLSILLYMGVQIKRELRYLYKEKYLENLYRLKSYLLLLRSGTVCGRKEVDNFYYVKVSLWVDIIFIIGDFKKKDKDFEMDSKRLAVGFQTGWVGKGTDPGWGRG